MRIGAPESSFVLATFVTACSIPIAYAVGAIDGPSALVPTHQKSVPRLGGLGIAAGIIAGTSFEELKFRWLCGLVVLSILGIYKDLTQRDISPLLQSIVQAAACCLAVIGSDLPYTAVAFAVLGGVALVNAMNFLDVVDGLCGTVSAIAAVGLWFLTRSSLPLALAFALLGFLVWNVPKAKTFMGDFGSFLIGFVLFQVVLDGLLRGASSFAILALVVPGVELVWTVGMRLKERRSPFLGDASHLSLALLRRGLSTWSVLAIFAVFSIISAFTMLLLT